MLSRFVMLLVFFTYTLSFPCLAESPTSLRKPESLAVIRTEGGLNYLSLSPNRQLLAYTDAKGQSLRILNLANHDVVEVTEHKTGPGFFWSPDGIRLFFRELIRDQEKVLSDLSAFDTKLNQKVVLDRLNGSSGYPILNPFNNTLTMIHEQGILQKRLEFPGERSAKWQKQKKSMDGCWVASQSGVLWLGELGLELKKMPDDGSGLKSFAVSPDGRRIAWASQAGQVYAALEGENTILIGEGRDPSWHPFRTMLVYAAARKIAKRVYDYDLRFTDLAGHSRYLTQTQDLQERWPIWLDGDTLLYTAEETTDLFKLDFLESAPIARNQITLGKP